MKKIAYLFIAITGTLIASLALYAIPVLLTCSFAFNWPGSAKFFLFVGMLIQLALTFGQIGVWADKDNVL